MTAATEHVTPPADAPAPAAPDAAPVPARRERLNPLNLLNSGFLVLWGIFTAFPLLWAVMTAFKTNREILSLPDCRAGWRFWVWLWCMVDPPTSLEFDNFTRAWTQASIGVYFINSIIVVSGSLVLTMLLGSMAAYALARYEFPGNRIIYFGFVGGIMFPVFLALVPLFFVVDNMKLIPVVGQYITLNSYGGLILVYVAYSLPFTVFFMSAFFRTLPTELAEAAAIDGCGHFRLFFQVMLPMAKPGLVSIGIFNFIGQWNQYVIPLVLMPDPDSKVLAQGLASLAVSMGYRGDWAALFAGLTLALLPLLAAYLLFQRQVQAGLSAGLLK
ncbi:MAG: ABC transporter permease subunit [Micromonosporaceae bacterium]|nr:ABC transporter permease subunit [Micromonosporaceae bacterium]